MIERFITLNCRHDNCRICTGCDHECHFVPMPADFRGLVQATPEENR